MEYTTGQKVIICSRKNPHATIRDIQVMLGLSSPSIVHYHLKRANMPTKKERFNMLMGEIDKLEKQHNIMQKALETIDSNCDSREFASTTAHEALILIEENK